MVGYKLIIISTIVDEASGSILIEYGYKLIIISTIVDVFVHIQTITKGL